MKNANGETLEQNISPRVKKDRAPCWHENLCQICAKTCLKAPTLCYRSRKKKAKQKHKKMIENTGK
jgi:hypothetical protein